MRKVLADEDLTLSGFECIKASHVIRVDRQFSTFLDEEACSGCRVCNGICPSLHFNEEKKIMNINTTSCKGCGVCVSICPSNALQQRHLDDGRVIGSIDNGKKIKPFDCKFCPVGVGEGDGDVRIFCSGRVEISHILEAILKGMHVVVIGCYYGEGESNVVDAAKEKMDMAKKLLSILGTKNIVEFVPSIQGERLQSILKVE